MRFLNLIFLCVLYMMSSVVHAAKWTSITFPDGQGEAVHCNQWGWIAHPIAIRWKNVCAPLEVKVGHRFITKQSTEWDCPDGFTAVYEYKSSQHSLNLVQCKMNSYES